MKTPILGSSYVARSVSAADDRMVNLFPEVVPEGGKSSAYLMRAPGMKFITTMVDDGPVRGLWTHISKNVFYIVSGQYVYKMTSMTATPTLIGTMSGTGTDPVFIEDNGDQVFFAAGGKGYVYTYSTNSFAQVTDVDFPGCGAVAFLDGRFYVNKPDTQLIYGSDIYNGSAWDPLVFASAEGSPDNVVTIASIHKELWVFGNKTIEIWYDAGNINFPLEPIQGAFLETGCLAAHSVAKLDNTLFWLGTDARGQGMIFKANGYSPMRVSTHAMEWQIQQYETLSDAVAYTYQQEGHSFYVINFPSTSTTWVYDVATGAWHERASFERGAFTRHRGNCQCNYNGHIIVGDWHNANIYEFDVNTYSDPVGVQRWLRSWRALPTDTNTLKRTSQHSLQLDCTAGVGVNEGQGSDPQVMLRWSDDGGFTWSSEHWMSMGKIGEYYRRVIWRRLGMTLKLRDRVYEISGTDPVNIAIMGAELIVDMTNA